MKVLLSTYLLIILFSLEVRSQQIPVWSHFNMQNNVYNPALSGINPFTEFQISHRSQWIGHDLAPSAQLLNVHSSIDKRNWAPGLILLSERNGVLSNLNVGLSYAYHIKIGEYTKLSLGLRANGYQNRLRADRMILDSQNDNLINTQQNDKQWSFNADAGIALHNEVFYIAIGSNQLVNAPFEFSNGATVTHLPHYNFLYGVNFLFGSKSLLQINGKNVLAEGLEMWQEYSLVYDYNKIFWAGIGYRHTDAIITMLGGKVWKDLHVYYSYDFGIGSLSSNNAGSHEVTLRYQYHYAPLNSRDKKRYNTGVYRGWKINLKNIFKKKPKKTEEEETEE